MKDALIPLNSKNEWTDILMKWGEDNNILEDVFTKNRNELTVITCLHFKNNDIRYLPKEIGNLSELKTLRIESSLLTELPPEIGNLKKLEVLDIKKSPLRKLPKEIGNLSELETLRVKSGMLTELPPEIGNLKKLEILDIRGNSIWELPIEIGGLVALRTLHLRRNVLSTIPKEIGNLFKLRTLSLSDNQLENLPDEIGKLSKLNVLRLRSNLLDKLPLTIKNLENLTSFNIANNPIKDLPSELISFFEKNNIAESLSMESSRSILKQIKADESAWYMKNRNRSNLHKCMGEIITGYHKELNNIYVWVNMFIDSIQYILDNDEYLNNMSLNLPSPKPNKIIKRTPDQLKDLIILAKEESLFKSSLVYIFAKYESFLNEAVFCVLQNKTDMNEFSIQQEISNFNRLSLNKKYKFLGKLIGKPIHSSFKISQMYEIKATRNLIIHNNQIIDQQYINRAGMYKRGSMGEMITCDLIYFSTSLSEIKNSIGQIGSSLRRELDSDEKNIKYNHVDTI